MPRISAGSLEIDDLRQLAMNCHELTARRDLAPLTQGNLDYLCGLYSIINALRLLRQPIEPIGQAAAQQLFEAGAASLLRKGLLDSALVDGIILRHWKQLAEYLTRKASTESLTLKIERPISFNKQLSAEVIEHWLVDSIAKGKPVLIHLGRKNQHYTVVAGIDRHSINLFDSWGLVRIKRAGFVLRHDITANCMMRLSLHGRN